MTLSKQFIYELKKHFVGDIRLDTASKVLYSTDASMYEIEPLGVAIPKNQDDLQSAVELAAKYRIPILPRGSGSSLGGQAIGEALILDCSRHLNSILEINPEEHYAIVEPGVILANLNRAVAKHGLTFGPDPASAERATMGGVIGNNATGAHSILYGMSADHLLEAEVILSDGSLARFDNSILDTRYSNSDSRISNIVSVVNEIRENYSESIKQNYPKSWRNSAGYRLNYLLPWSPSKPPQWNGDYPNSKLNLASLLAGSEGTLAVIRKMKVNLVSKPKYTILGVLQYQSIEEACDDVPRLLEFNPSAIELIPQMILQLARSVPAVANQMSWIAGNPEAILVVEFSGDQMSALKEAVRGLDTPSAKNASGYSTTSKLLTIAESVEEQNRIWNIRKSGLGILDSCPQNARPIAFIEDCAIPVDRLGEFVREVQKILQAHQTYAGIYAHASGGCLHIRPVLDLTRGEGVRAMRSIVEQVYSLTMKLGGSMSSEHGDGISSGEFIERTYGKEITDAMRKLKQAADPDGILNPKKLFDAPPMDSNLRYGENYQVEVWDSALHFEHEHGLAGAIEMCNGQGVCRKHNGVMCPSFQATGEEGLSTRGRANLLRAVISNQLSVISNEIRDTSYELQSANYELRITNYEKRKEQLTQATFHTLDLCLACKGCTSECPSGVDMPRLKYEFMNQYYKSHHRPLHDYLFAYFHVIAKWISPIAPVVNFFGKLDWSKKIATQVLGITDKRPLPLFANHKTYKTSQTNSTNQTQTVIFLSDVFSEYLEPEVKEAAIDLLNYFGYEVKVLPMIGAGAAFLSKGFIEQAKRHAEKVLGEIKRLGAESIVGVVGCEPPEVYCLKHEYVALLPNRKEEIESISKNVFLVEGFILRVVKLGKLNILPDETNKEKVFFHPHCHQRAEGELATVELLKLFGFDVELSDAGCCGMAGTFGFDKEHYELSMQIGEMKLLPQVRKMKEEIVVSSGAACRMQIQHGAGVEAKHPLVVMRDVIYGSH
ncbi:MAG: FAD-binding protein [Anaerolineales bacterium]|nr:FAD-binding protein [Anaerolineales bacterium]MBX3038111.1 FAD-binding protein [Anaerolineales bacterium]